ncbi:hypothetical protein DACRYDRAFT_24149 [Dacryopinax primogenitus]|uniref:Uncharacterized protein n=1 Tax=Dacryopinax primogenitus (strain DJM 731) TaxID=1858805 RepID=M5FZU6_DACPD|nr:uncharacterized protein DACRYDRAFT_24149 [Dacryopinax primogenitus]EJT99081.1 hypothetical protein DACRYDRAFT_24149 [Dacryopinax primogenitus]
MHTQASCDFGNTKPVQEDNRETQLVHIVVMIEPTATHGNARRRSGVPDAVRHSHKPEKSVNLRLNRNICAEMIAATRPEAIPAKTPSRFDSRFATATWTCVSNG